MIRLLAPIMLTGLAALSVDTQKYFLAPWFLAILIVFIVSLFYLVTILLYPTEFVATLTESTYLVIDHYSHFFNCIKLTHFSFPSDYDIIDAFHLIIPLMLVLTRGYLTTLWQKLSLLALLPASILIVNSIFI